MIFPARLALGLALAMLAIPAARAADCGPDKLGVSRVQKVGVQGGLDVGWKTYPDTIPLADHEVILTFDDGPDPKTTPQVLEALRQQCVRATFFAIGRNADDHPKLMRREVEEGHNVAFHTYSHPQPTLRYMSDAAARADILKGVIAVERAAYGADFSKGEPDDLAKLKLHAPFFRFPGFADTADLRKWFAANNVAIFGVDLWASDWVKMTPDEELKLILARLEKAKKGMLLLHDNKTWTADMLPRFLVELKQRGYHVVHIEAGPGHGPTEPAPAGWRSETERTLSAIKPRLEHAAAAAAAKNVSFPVKPAPQD
ncbi:MAG: polysaccharide deacetylase family protein [Pseudomonadota bacterium]|nr:polysaccharide deacetylase family protein [Pseudomonadota bacterium]